MRRPLKRGILGPHTIIISKYIHNILEKKAFHGFTNKKLFSNIFMNFINPIFERASSIPQFKGHGMRNLQYEIRVCQNINNKVTLTS